MIEFLGEMMRFRQLYPIPILCTISRSFNKCCIVF